MALLNLLQLLQSDDQVTFTDKINYNLDQILSMGGGPIGPTGFIGQQGVPGAQGIQGFQGLPGADGARWYVQLSTNLVFVPTPKLGDLWLQTDTLSIYEFLGSPGAWVSLGFTLVSPGVFTQVTNNVLFSNPNPLRSLVISPINYLGLDSPGTPNYKLKVIGTSGNPMMRFGIDDGGVETVQAFQPTISIQKLVDVTYPSSLDWKFNLDNLNGDIFFNLNGNYLGIYPQIATVSRFDFGTQTRLQNNPADRLLSFAVANTGSEFFHIGRHTALATTSDRLFSIMDTGQLSIGDAFSNPSGAIDFHTDFLEADLALAGPPSPNHWLRLRGRTDTSGSTYDMLTVSHNRLFSDLSAGPTNQSSMIKIQHDTNNTLAHFISFTGGVDDPSAINPPNNWPQIRFGFGDPTTVVPTSDPGYYFSADQNGRIGIGDKTFITRYSNVNTGSFGSKLNVQGNPTGWGGDTITGGSSFSGIHLVPKDFIGAQVGITAGGIGLGSDPITTFAGIHFQDNSLVPDQGMDLHIGTSIYADGGEKTRMTIQRFGDTNFWSKSSTTQYLIIEPGGRNDPANGLLIPNDNVHIGTLDGSVWKNLILNAGSEIFTGFGSGFVGIGQYAGFGEDIIGPSAILIVGQFYIPKGGVAVHNAVTYPAGIPFQAVNVNLTSGTVSQANPATKFHVNESATFGTRTPIPLTGYPFYVGLNSFTIGNNHQATGNRNIIVGGFGHTASGTDGIIIGYAGAGNEVNMIDANKVLIATNTHVSVKAPTAPLTATLISSNYGVPGIDPMNYRNSSNSIFKISSMVNPPPFFTGERGNIGRVAVIEARTSGLGLTEIPVGLEFHIRNPNTSRSIGMVYGNYTEIVGGGNTNQIGKISIATLIHTYTFPTVTPTSGAMYEIANFSTNGLQFVPFTDEFLNNTKPRISVEDSKIPDHPGDPLYVQAGGGNDAAHGATGATVGGNLYLNAGAGGFGGADGSILIGNGAPAFDINTDILISKNKVEIHSTTNTAVFGDMKFLNNVSLGSAVSAGGYLRIINNSYAGGPNQQFTMFSVAYDRILQFVVGGAPNSNTIVEAGLNESPSNLGLTYMRLGIVQQYGCFTLNIPAGVNVYVEADPGGATFNLSVFELKFGRH